MPIAPIKEAVTVPSVLGYTYAEAENLLKKAGFNVLTEGSGNVVLDQIPHADSQVEAGSSVLLYLGTEAGAPTSSDWWAIAEEVDVDIQTLLQMTWRVPLTEN